MTRHSPTPGPERSEGPDSDRCQGSVVRPATKTLTVISLSLCVASLVLWARSYRACDVLVRPRSAQQRVCVTSEFGKLVVEIEAPQQHAILDGWEYFDTPLPRRWPVARGTLGFDVYGAQVTHYVRLPPTPLKGVALPHWFLVLVTVILPGAALVRMRRRATARRRSAAGLCARCGYDIRASAARCPECGTLTPLSPVLGGEGRGEGLFEKG